MKKQTKRFTKSKHSVYNVAYHLIWCPKYRRKVLVGDIEKRLVELLKGKAQYLEVSIETMQIMPDHVHLLVKMSPVDSPHHIIQQLKGCSSKALRQEFPELLKMPTLWTRSYYCESIGHISEDTIKKYIDNQKNV